MTDWESHYFSCLVTGKCLDGKAFFSPLSSSYSTVIWLLHLNCLADAQPKVTVTSLLSGPIDTSWTLPWFLSPICHCFGPFDPSLLLGACSFNWGAPHSLGFPPRSSRSFSLSSAGWHSSALHLHAGASPSSALGPYPSWTILPMGLVSTSLGLTDSQTEGGLVKAPARR